MNPLVLLTPVFMAFEVAQLVVAERYLGIKQIERNADPRLVGPREPVAFLWLAGLMVYGGWVLLLLLTVPAARMQAVCLLAISLAGFTLRRNTTLAWTLVLLTFEGALRLGMLLSLLVFIWHQS
ncbi:hypothetical protein K0B96_11270 [Horticoccus luteus]|uniref:Uncharacterized protein n=1 Tax=Horticoccus luteus TaxID=2862869 RepID=A0A8F9TRY0_9BACT|nr:hypothetical protein [Horticoccus luteus]QYM77896.1 hypothetical protein K0B96_11270 [Horticoccus luteus]